ncbi:MAG: hypothetical protein JO148_08630, partial [Acidimicrobiia bacterium]|nr:hypothetical protein [Acidimicrobiia bacterium]
GGRTTPRGGTPGRAESASKRLPLVPDSPVQPGKRPSNPAFLVLLALVWIAAGVYAIVALSASWKLIPGIFFIGVGILFLRGAAVTVRRREDQ